MIPGIKPTNDAIIVGFDGLGSINDGFDSAMSSPKIPAAEEGFGSHIRLKVEVLEGEADLVGFGGLRIALGDVECSESFLLMGGQVDGILEPDITCLGEFRAPGPLLAPHFVDRFVNQFDARGGECEVGKGAGTAAGGSGLTARHLR